MSFAWPLSFLLVLPLALAAWRMLRRGRRAGIRFSAVPYLPAKTAGWRAKAANLAPFVFLLGALALVIAAARPREALSQGRRNVDAIAIAMTVDVSGSMEIIDVSRREIERIHSEADAAKLPTRLDMGHLRVEFESSNEPTGPFGAKSIGEIVINTPAPAIAHAIYRATGVWHRELPITPEAIAMDTPLT